MRIVPQARAGIVERLGRYSRTLEPGLTLIVPFIDRVKPLIDLREQVVSFPPQPVITEDNLVVGIDTVIYFTVTDPRAATYEVANPLQAIEQLTVTTLRNVIGGMTLEETLTSRDNVNNQLRAVLDEATGRWGIRVNRVELKSVEPPRTVQEAMEKQMRAERDRRATILTAEGVKQSADPHRRGREAVRRPARRGPAHRRDPQGRGRGEGDRDRLRRDPRRRARPGAALLPVPADAARSSRRASANKVFVIPSEFSQALSNLTSRFGEGIPEHTKPKPRPTRTATRSTPAPRPTPRRPPAPPARPSEQAESATDRSAARPARDRAAAARAGLHRSPTVTKRETACRPSSATCEHAVALRVVVRRPTATIPESIRSDVVEADVRADLARLLRAREQRLLTPRTIAARQALNISESLLSASFIAIFVAT